jgi:hypothetical protein
MANVVISLEFNTVVGFEQNPFGILEKLVYDDTQQVQGGRGYAI